jgi:hypothetical protein
MEYICDNCNKEFISNSHLNRHLNKKKLCVKQIIKCTNCLKEFKTKQQLDNHINRQNKCIKIDLEIENKKLKEETTNKILQLIEENKQLNKEIINLKKEKIKENDINITNKNINNNIIIGYVYIVSNLCYELQDIYKIGQTTNKDRRLSSYNTGKMTKDKFKYLYIIETEHFIELEKLIFKYLENYKVNNEMYKINLEKLKNIIKKLNSKLIIENEILNLIL